MPRAPLPSELLARLQSDRSRLVEAEALPRKAGARTSANSRARFVPPSSPSLQTIRMVGSHTAAFAFHVLENRLKGPTYEEGLRRLLRAPSVARSSLDFLSPRTRTRTRSGT